MATKHTSKCLLKAADNEPIFVLRAQDVSAPGAILQWIYENWNTCGEQKLRDAFETAMAMKNWPSKKSAD